MRRLHVEGLRVSTNGGKGLVHGIDLHVDEGEWLSIVGESGSGKSMTAFAIADLLPRGVRREAGAITLNGEDILHRSPAELRKLRGSAISYVFQDYQGAFTPFIRLGTQMAEAIRAHRRVGARESTSMIHGALEEVGLDGGVFAERYPFQLSGGQLQRASLATAMLLSPQLLIADEPTTALDAVTQAAVLDLINSLRERHGCSVLFITHDLRCVIRHADRVAVMRSGDVIETGETSGVVAHPERSYTRDLFAAVPRIDIRQKRLPVHNQKVVS
ncbi:ABC transporter ATP-binding protein [Corynebacterium pacaense]|uniref:ABC transporter ATP-binding protein n=1 Tax=Corynebacterium pacaense TaxID=1816684 RepID=UPI0009B97C0E|nr:ABC transporter ATP-binding protein [Corynebacterium pacaense]